MVNAADERVAAKASKTWRRVVRFGTSADCDVWADEIARKFPAPLTFRAHADGESCVVRSQLVGTYWTASLVAALTVARQL